MAILLAGCAAPPAVGPSAPPAPSAAAPAAPNSAPVNVAATPATGVATPGAAATPATPTSTPCGALGCLAFETPEAALEHVLASNPRVLAVGEAHAQKGTEGVTSATRRFTEQLLPRLAGRASDLVLELWVADGSCGKVETKVAEQQRPVTESQAQGNQNEFVALGRRAKELRIRPHALTPTCAEYAEIANAGPSDVDRMLSMIAEATARDVTKLLAAPGATAASGAPARLVVAYGGALHNDVTPRPGRERWTFGPALSEHTGGAYVELDLIVPEFVKDTESWRALPWYAAYEPARHARQTLLYAPAKGSFALIFPKSNPTAPPAP